MSFMNATPEYVAAAASDLANIGSAIGDANSAAAGPTSSVSAAGADVVSETIAQLFGTHAQAYQAISAQAALFHQQFVQLMSSGAAEYAGVEAANAAPLQAAQPLISGAAQAGSVAAGVPTASAVQAPAAVAVAPAAAVAGQLPTAIAPAVAAPAGAAVAAAPVAPPGATGAVLASARADAPGYPAAPSAPSVTSVTAATDGAGPASALAAAPQAETTDFSPSSALPAAVPPVAGAPAVLAASHAHAPSSGNAEGSKMRPKVTTR